MSREPKKYMPTSVDEYLSEAALNEIGDGGAKPFPWKYVDDRSDGEVQKYTFTSPGKINYDVSFVNTEYESGDERPIWSCWLFADGFGKGNMDTNKGEIYGIMATMIQIVKHFISEMDEDYLEAIIFDSDKDFRKKSSKVKTKGTYLAGMDKLVMTYAKKLVPSKWKVYTRDDGTVISLTGKVITESALNEVGDANAKPLPYKRERDPSDEGSPGLKDIVQFRIDNGDDGDFLTFYCYGGKVWDMDLADITGFGAASPGPKVFSMMATIQKATDEFIKEKKPEAIRINNIQNKEMKVFKLYATKNTPRGYQLDSDSKTLVFNKI